MFLSLNFAKMSRLDLSTIVFWLRELMLPWEPGSGHISNILSRLFFMHYVDFFSTVGTMLMGSHDQLLFSSFVGHLGRGLCCYSWWFHAL